MSDAVVEEPLEPQRDEDLAEDVDLDEDVDLGDEGTRGSGPQSFLAGLVLGTIFGLSVAVLFAPEPGEETRRKLGKRMRRLRKRAEDEAKGLRRKAKKRLARVRR